MGIMGCYPDKRAIENELGGKWTLLYEYEFNESHAEGFEFPHDIDDTPLNLNGLYIIVDNSISTTINFIVNGAEIISTTFGFTSNQRTMFTSIIKNGMHEFSYLARHNIDSASSVNLNTYPNAKFFADSITNFSLALTGSAGAKVKFYCLRGV